MNYDKIAKKLLEEGYIDDRNLVCHSYRNYTMVKDYGVATKYNNFISSFWLPSFMILSIKDDYLHISYAKAFGGFKKHYASFKLSSIVFREEITVDKVIKVYLFNVENDENDGVVGKFFIIGLKAKDKVEKLVSEIIKYNKDHVGEKYQYELSGLPRFTYFTEGASKKIFSINRRKKHCQICGKISEYLYDGPIYSENELKTVCPYCIENGEASKVANCLFNDPTCGDNISEEDINIIKYKTPSVNTWNDLEWRFCCDKPSIFIGLLNWHEVKKLGLEEIVTKLIKDEKEFVEIFDSFSDIIDNINEEEIGLCVYRCPKCGKYQIELFID